jgi:hypothetical protein
MEDLGHYKTNAAKTFRCHFNSLKKVAFAMGPLPDLSICFEVEAENTQKAREKLSQAIGRGIFVK